MTRPVIHSAVPIHDRLLWYVLAAAIVGGALPSVALTLAPAVAVMLAGQVLGVALTITATDFVPVVSKPWTVLVALVVSWICFPVAGILALHYLPDAVVGRGALIVSVSPAEITSALVVIIAGGSGALAITCMAGSLLLSTILTPLWLQFALGGVFHIDERALILELLLSLSLPLLVGVGVRTVIPSIDRWRSWCLDLSAISVALVVLVAAASARSHLHPEVLPLAAGVCLALIAGGLGLGWVTGMLATRSIPEQRAVLYVVGMREFGVATAIAVAVAPASAGIAGLYGVLLMIGSATLAQRLRR